MLLDALHSAFVAQGLHGVGDGVGQLRVALARAGDVEVGGGQGRAHVQLAVGDLGPDVEPFGHAGEPGVDAPHQQQLGGLVAQHQVADLFVCEAFAVEDVALGGAQPHTDLPVALARFLEALHRLVEAEEHPVQRHDRGHPGVMGFALGGTGEGNDQQVAAVHDGFLRPGPGLDADAHPVAGALERKERGVADDAVALGVLDQGQRWCIGQVQVHLAWLCLEAECETQQGDDPDRFGEHVAVQSKVVQRV